MTNPDPAPVIELIDAFRRSKAMFTAVRLGLFDRLEIWPSRQWDQYEEKHVGAYRAGKLGPSGR